MTLPLDLPKWLYKEIEREATNQGVGIQRIIKDTLATRFKEDTRDREKV